MIKLALIGDSAVRYYAVADRLWELISVVTHKKFKFTIMPLATPQEVLAAFEAFKKDRSYIGFNIVAPWKDVLSGKVDAKESISNLSAINMVYKDDQGVITGVNTDPLAAQLAIESQANLYKCDSVLVIGEKEAGLPIAHHLRHTLNKKAYLYDPHVQCSKEENGIICLSSLSEVAERTYDLIINTTPLGRYYANKHVEAFTSPLDLETLDQISHPDTIVQETNYLPSNTLLLQMARHLKLKTITGELTLVFEATESLRRYFDITLDENTIRMLVQEISMYISERETEILEQK